jgi:hypothetical protein
VQGRHLVHLRPARFFFAERRIGLDQLSEEVHVLARCYHWSEAEILQLPATRRRRYLALIARDAGAREAA